MKRPLCRNCCRKWFLGHDLGYWCVIAGLVGYPVRADGKCARPLWKRLGLPVGAPPKPTTKRGREIAGWFIRVTRD
jgi:hypothetical protein